MTETEAMNLIRICIRDVTGYEVDLDADTDLRNADVLDSLDLMMLLLRLEEATGNPIADSALPSDGTLTVGALVAVMATS